MAFGERVVVGGVRSIVRTGNAEIGEQQCGGFGLHRTAAISMQGELAGWHLVLCNGVVEQRPEQHRALRISHTPADHTATEDVEDDVKIEVAPFSRSHQFGDVPGPDLIGPFGQQFGLPVDRMTELLTAFADFVVVPRARDTWCGSSSGRRLHRAGWRRSRPVPGRRSVAHAADRAPPARWRTVSARVGFGRRRGTTGGAIKRARRRCTLARETPSAAQTAAVMPLTGANATTASVMARRRSASTGCPATQQLFFGCR